MRRYILLFAAVLILFGLCACGAADTGSGSPKTTPMPLRYAQHFSVEQAPNGASLLTLGGQERFWLLPHGVEAPWEPELPSISVPVARVYLASSSVADFFLQLGALDAVAYTSTLSDNWFFPELREALEQERMLYIGKYSAPDYELLLSEDCDLVVENTMILHAPSTREKLEALGFPLMVEYSSYEPHPLGRVEWIKLYGLLLGKSEEANAFFERQCRTFEALPPAEEPRLSVAFFHITANGAVTVRKSSDYVTRMIQLAGGESAFSDLPPDDNALSTMTIQMESFYAQARDADLLIYNSTVGAEIRSTDQLLELCPLLAEFKAVKNGRLWCTEQSMFQHTTAAADMIAELYKIIHSDTEGELRYFHPID